MKKNIREDFHSIYQMLSVMGSRKNNHAMRDNTASERSDYDAYQFTMAQSYGDAERLLRDGYIDVLPEIRSGVNENLKRTEIRHRRHVETNVVGYCPHVPNAILGLPNSMIMTKTQPQKVKAVSIIMDVDENANVNVKDFVKCGICVLSAINSLEVRGFRVNLKIAFVNAQAGEQSAVALVTVKDYREHLDLQKLCFPLCHPSMVRRFGFKWTETHPEIEDTHWSFGYGKHCNSQNFLKEGEVFINLKKVNKCEYDPEKLIESMNLK